MTFKWADGEDAETFKFYSRKAAPDASRSMARARVAQSPQGGAKPLSD
jgi:hypothetical protein